MSGYPVHSVSITRTVLILGIFIHSLGAHAQEQSSTQSNNDTTQAMSCHKHFNSYKQVLINPRVCDADESEAAAELNQKPKRPKCTADKGCDIALNCHNYTASNATLGEAQVLQVSPLQLQSIVEDVNVTNNCVLVMFYAPWCEYSVQFARRYNTVGRMFREIPILAVDLSANDPHKYVLAYLPVVALYHQGRVVYRFTLTESIQELRDTIVKMTKSPPLPATLDERESEGPVPVVRVREELPLLYFSFGWIVFVLAVFVVRSSRLSDCINRLWRVRAA